MRPLLAIFSAAALLSAAGIDTAAYLAHIKYLASPELKGRRTGTPELETAAAYIANQLRQAGLAPVAGSYWQQFEVTARTALGSSETFTATGGARSLTLRKGVDFTPLNLSANGSKGGTLVFAGYGITAPEFHYDDYANIDAAGKIVLILRHEPQENDDKSIFSGKNFTTHSEISNKVANAKLHGAAGVVLVNDLPNHPADDDTLEKFTPLMGTEDYGILVDQVTAKAAAQLLARDGRDLRTLTVQIDRSTAPASFALSSEVKLTVAIEQQQRHVHNVIGYFPGETGEYVVIGAHYDHLGLGEQDSLAPSQVGTVHPGADDNASGTAGVIELAKKLAAGPKQKRGFLFLCFAGEEEGLLGSAYYASHPVKPLTDAIAMINMDMIGRLRDNKVYIGGIGTGSTFRPLVQRAAKDAGLQDDESEAGGYGASDHTSFTTHRVPTLFFFSGLHSDYHKPSDTWDKINAKDAVRVLDEVAEIASALSNAAERPAFVRVVDNPHAGPLSSSGSSGYGPYFGSIPDFGGPANGVRFSDVKDNSPAAKAGLKAGDILIEFDGKPIQNLYDFTYALRAHKAGDDVPVKVLRDNKAIQVRVLLTKRQ